MPVSGKYDSNSSAWAVPVIIVGEDTVTVSVNIPGSITASLTGTQSVSIVNAPTVSVSNTVSVQTLNTQTVSGTVSITNAPTVSVSGTVVVDSELSAAAALADSFANPTTAAVGSHLMAFDGSTWNRVASHYYYSTNSVSAAHTSSVLTCSTSPKADYSLQATRDAGSGGFTLSLQVSLDGTNFFEVTNSATNSGVISVAGKPARFVRAVLSIAASTTLSYQLLAA
jgi:epidermal growth factor receptor substrate 15